MRVFGWLLGDLPRAVVGMDRVDAVLNEKGSVSYGARASSAVGGAGARAETVGYLYPETEYADLSATTRTSAAEMAVEDRRGIESVTLDVPPGKTVALVGPTGSGKSTFAHLLVRLFDPDRGADPPRRPRLARPRQIDAGPVGDACLSGDIPVQRHRLQQHQPAEADPGSEVIDAARLAQADGFIAELPDGYYTLVGERGASLSGGQRQRIALARAIVRRPRLLVLDDATSAVDPSVEGVILAGLAELDTTVVIVAYRRSSIVLADEVIYIEDGRAIDRGTHDELYRRLPVLPRADRRLRAGGGHMTVGVDTPGRATGALDTIGAVSASHPSCGAACRHHCHRARLYCRQGHRPGRHTADHRPRPLSGGVDMGFVVRMVGVALVAVLITAGATGWMDLRLARVSETALSGVRIRAFRHIHDLSMLHQASEQRGVLVARVTSDVDQISRFMQWAGLMLIVNSGQALLALVVMLVLSPLLGLVVIALIPLIVVTMWWFQTRLEVAFLTVREKVGRMLALLAETVVGAPVIRAYGIEERTRERLGEAIEDHRSSAVYAGSLSATFSGVGELLSALVVAAVLVVGTVLAVHDLTSVGTVLAFLFLVQLFVQPMQMLGEAVNEAQTAVAGWRRVLDILDIAPDVSDPGPDGVELPHEPVGASFFGVTFRYPMSRGDCRRRHRAGRPRRPHNRHRTQESG